MGGQGGLNISTARYRVAELEERMYCRKSNDVPSKETNQSFSYARILNVSRCTSSVQEVLTSSEMAEPITRQTFPTSFPGCCTRISFTPPIASLLTPEFGCLNRKRTSSSVRPLEVIGSPDGPCSTRSIGFWFGRAIAIRQPQHLQMYTGHTSSFEGSIGRV